MKKIVSILRLDFWPDKPDVAMLVLRLWFGLSLLVLHGWGKLSNFQGMSKRFSDPLGVGSQASLSLALVGEVLCPILLVLGFFTRTAALGAAITMAVAFFLVHGGALKGGNSGEMAFIYLAGFVAIFLAGPGRYALDGSGKSGAAAPKKPKPPR